MFFILTTISKIFQFVLKPVSLLEKVITGYFTKNLEAELITQTSRLDDLARSLHASQESNLRLQGVIAELETQVDELEDQLLTVRSYNNIQIAQVVERADVAIGYEAPTAVIDVAVEANINDLEEEAKRFRAAKIINLAVKSYLIKKRWLEFIKAAAKRARRQGKLKVNKEKKFLVDQDKRIKELLEEREELLKKQSSDIIKDNKTITTTAKAPAVLPKSVVVKDRETAPSTISLGKRCFETPNDGWYRAVEKCLTGLTVVNQRGGRPNNDKFFFIESTKRWWLTAGIVESSFPQNLSLDPKVRTQVVVPILHRITGLKDGEIDFIRVKYTFTVPEALSEGIYELRLSEADNTATLKMLGNKWHGGLLVSTMKLWKPSVKRFQVPEKPKIGNIGEPASCECGNLICYCETIEKSKEDFKMSPENHPRALRARAMAEKIGESSNQTELEEPPKEDSTGLNILCLSSDVVLKDEVATCACGDPILNKKLVYINDKRACPDCVATLKADINRARQLGLDLPKLKLTTKLWDLKY